MRIISKPFLLCCIIFFFWPLCLDGASKDEGRRHFVGKQGRKSSSERCATQHLGRRPAISNLPSGSPSKDGSRVLKLGSTSAIRDFRRSFDLSQSDEVATDEFDPHYDTQPRHDRTKTTPKRKRKSSRTKKKDSLSKACPRSREVRLNRKSQVFDRDRRPGLLDLPSTLPPLISPFSQGKSSGSYNSFDIEESLHEGFDTPTLSPQYPQYPLAGSKRDEEVLRLIPPTGPIVTSRNFRSHTEKASGQKPLAPSKKYPSFSSKLSDLSRILSKESLERVPNSDRGVDSDSCPDRRRKLRRGAIATSKSQPGLNSFRSPSPSLQVISTFRHRALSKHGRKQGTDGPSFEKFGLDRLDTGVDNPKYTRGFGITRRPLTGSPRKQDESTEEDETDYQKDKADEIKKLDDDDNEPVLDRLEGENIDQFEDEECNGLPWLIGCSSPPNSWNIRMEDIDVLKNQNCKEYREFEDGYAQYIKQNAALDRTNGLSYSDVVGGFPSLLSTRMDPIESSSEPFLLSSSSSSPPSHSIGTAEVAGTTTTATSSSSSSSTTSFSSYSSIPYLDDERPRRGLRKFSISEFQFIRSVKAHKKTIFFIAREKKITDQDANVIIKFPFRPKKSKKPFYPSMNKEILNYMTIGKCNQVLNILGYIDDTVLESTGFYHSPAIVFEYCGMGDLREFIRKNMPDSNAELTTGINSEVILMMMKDVLLGLKHLHDRNLVHRNIKMENILIKTDGPFKLSNFKYVHDLTTPFTEEEVQLDLRRRSISYSAPELLVNTGLEGIYAYSKKTDIYLVGLLFFEILSGEKAIPSYIKDEDRMRTYLSENFYITKSLLSLMRSPLMSYKLQKLKTRLKQFPYAFNFLLRLLMFSESERYSVDEALCDPIFIVAQKKETDKSLVLEPQQ